MWICLLFPKQSVCLSGLNFLEICRKLYTKYQFARISKKSFFCTLASQSVVYYDDDVLNLLPLCWNLEICVKRMLGKRRWNVKWKYICLYVHYYNILQNKSKWVRGQCNFPVHLKPLFTLKSNPEYRSINVLKWTKAGDGICLKEK